MENQVIESSIKKFQEALIEGLNGIVKASEIYVAAIDDDPRNADKFRDACADYVPASAWARFEAVGRKWMHPRLLMGGILDNKKASLIKRLPYSLQERIFQHERFPLLVGGGSHIKVDILEASYEQTEQLCNKTAMRSLSEQKAWLESATATIPEKGELMPYTVGNGKVFFRRGVTMTKREVQRILQEM